MKVGIIGSGVVGQTLGRGLIDKGYEVKVGTRDASKLNEWLSSVDNKGTVGSFSDAAEFGDVIIIATLWAGTQNALMMAGRDNFRDKIVIDITNPLDFSGGNPGLGVTYPTSGSEQIAEWIPGAKLVKAFNIIPAHIMIDPKQLGDADLFIAGDDQAKEFVKHLAKGWGWHDVVDMGDLSSAYWVEMLGMFVINYGFKYNDWNFAVKLLRKNGL